MYSVWFLQQCAPNFVNKQRYQLIISIDKSVFLRNHHACCVSTYHVRHFCVMTQYNWDGILCLEPHIYCIFPCEWDEIDQIQIQESSVLFMVFCATVILQIMEITLKNPCSYLGSSDELRMCRNIYTASICGIKVQLISVICTTDSLLACCHDHSRAKLRLSNDCLWNNTAGGKIRLCSQILWQIVQKNTDLATLFQSDLPPCTCWMQVLGASL